jgi:hypothetical protein
MDWRHPFLIIDQNQIRDTNALAQAAAECRRNGSGLLIPDGAFLEFAKGGQFFQTTKQSLTPLAPYRELLVMARPISTLIREELAGGRPSESLIHNGTTGYLRSLLRDLEDADERELRTLADGPAARLMPGALAAWNNHGESKHLVQSLHDAFKRDMRADRLKSLRQLNELAASTWLSSLDGSRFVFQWFTQQGVSNLTAVIMARTPNVAAGFASAVAALAIDWLAMGGIDAAQPPNLSSDLHDIEYIVLGAVSRSLMTTDRRAARICRAVAAAFEVRSSSSWLKSDLNSK